MKAIKAELEDKMSEGLVIFGEEVFDTLFNRLEDYGCHQPLSL